jgi:tRNA(Phe) wybutosine-synthesizing methylase Tyw3
VALKDSLQGEVKEDQQVKLAALLNDYIAQVSTKMERFENEIDNKLNMIKT